MFHSFSKICKIKTLCYFLRIKEYYAFGQKLYLELVAPERAVWFAFLLFLFLLLGKSLINRVWFSATDLIFVYDTILGS